MKNQLGTQGGVYVRLLAWLALVFTFVRQTLVVQKQVQKPVYKMWSSNEFCLYVSLRLNKLACTPTGVSVA